MLAPANVDLGQSPLEQLPLLVQLPSHLANYFKEVGYMPTRYNESRSVARMRVRCEAVLTSLIVPPFIQRTETTARVLLKDLSKVGLGFLCHQQMWPTETFRIHLQGRTLDGRVVRCHKLGENCYDVGSLLLLVDSADKSAQ